MAGMFYTLQQAAEKLNMTEQQVEQLVTQGKLREFRDGANVHLKISEVDAFTAETPASTPPQEAPAQKAPPAQPPAVPATPSQQAPPAPPKQSLDDTDIALFDEGSEEAKPDAKLDDFALDSGSGSAISLGADSGGGDIAADEDGINVLGETGSDVMSPDDSLSETVAGTDTGTGEASLQEIEDDVNLDTFGSGSGLLDLSLQADDTSLGGILDEIYTSEGEQETGESSALDFGGGGDEPTLPDDEALAEAEPDMAMVPMMGPAIMQAAPDTMSNAMGIVLVLPLILIVYTAIVSVAGQQGVMPSVLGKLQAIGAPYGINIIWYVMGGVAVVSGLILAGAAMLGGGTGKAKKAKVKKAKAPKPKKEKKTRKPSKTRKGK